MPQRKVALITGIAGQDGSYLAEYLLSIGYEVHGLLRPELIENADRKLYNLEFCLLNIRLHYTSLLDLKELYSLVSSVQPTEIYHLAAESFVSRGFSNHSELMSSSYLIINNLMEAVRFECRDAKVFFAGSSEMFGTVSNGLINETNHFRPRSAYGIARVACYHLLKKLSADFGVFVSTGFLFNHESPRRDSRFLSKKITSGIVGILAGKRDQIELGDLGAVRDWGYAYDYVRAMHLLLQSTEPADYVISTGKEHSVRDFLEIAFSSVNLNYTEHVISKPELVRFAGYCDRLVGDPSRISAYLNWSASTSFSELVSILVEHELCKIRDR